MTKTLMQKRNLAKTWLITTLISLLFATESFAGTLTLRLGPGSVGNGGANPLGIPPGAADIELNWLSASNWETSLSVIPGLLLGKRQDFGNFYCSLGGGIVIDANGSGLGPYSAFGWESDTAVKISFEYKQAIGLTGNGIISPYALRMGFGYGF